MLVNSLGKSEISKRSYTLSDVESLMDNLSAQLPQHLLFLKSVEKIGLYKCQQGQTTATLIRQAHAKITNREDINDQSLMRYFSKKSIKIPDSRINTQTSTLVAVTGNNDSGKLVRGTPMESDSVITMNNVAASKDAFYDMLVSTREENMPTSSYVITIKDMIDDFTGKSVEFLVVTGIRGGSAKEIACDPSRRHLKLVPVSLCNVYASCSYLTYYYLTYYYLIVWSCRSMPKRVI